MTTPAQPAGPGRSLVTVVTDMPWPEAVQYLSTDGDRLITGTACLLMGWSFANESASNPFRLALYDGADSKGHRVAEIAAAANDGAALFTGWPGIKVPGGLYAVASSGTFHGAVYVVPVRGGF